MADGEDKLDAFVQFNEHELLTNAGNVRRDVAKKRVENRCAEFNARRKGIEAAAADEANLAEIERLGRRTEQ